MFYQSIFTVAALGSIPPAPETVSQKLVATIFSDTQAAVASYSQNHPGVQAQCEAFIAELRQLLANGEILEHEVARILSGLRFSAEKHQHQTRKGAGQIPYIIHPIGVAHTLATLGQVRDPDVLIAALLHDTVEDTNTSFDEIRAQFGERVESIVRELTDDKSLPKDERKYLQIVNAPHKSPEAAQIKLSDKLYNLTDLLTDPPPGWSAERIDTYFRWAQQVVDALPEVNAPLKQAVDEVIAAYFN